MNATLYYNTSPDNKIKKTLKNGNAITVRYKDDTRTVNPVLIISPDVNMKNYNYIIVEGDVNRCYFIKDVVMKHQMYEVECHVDVLMTYQPNILSQSVILKRTSDGDYVDEYLNDDKFQLRNLTRIQMKKFDSGFREQGSKVASYVLALNGGNGTSNNNEGGGD